MADRVPTRVDPADVDAARVDPAGVDPAGADAIVIGAGHNGLVTAAYLARAGLRTTLLEARSAVGGTAASEPFGGATVNICNCDHLTFRTTPVFEELGLAAHGLRYLDLEPTQVHIPWDGEASWTQHHDLDATLDELARAYPDDVDGYRRYVAAARPVIELVLAAANQPPTARNLARVALRRRLAGSLTALRWSRQSAADVLRSYLSADAISAAAVVAGPMVWGISPEFPGTGLGALPLAMRHVARVGRPVGGSGALTDAMLAAFEHHGGQLRLDSRVDTILCDAERVRGVALTDGTEIEADIVVSACNPHDTFLRWLRRPPAAADDLVRRWSAVEHAQGYESKVDAVLDRPYVLRGFDEPFAATTYITPSLADTHRGYELMGRGEILDRPAFLANQPTVLDSSLAPSGQHVLSLEALFTPYRFNGGWECDAEPTRWLEHFAELCEPGLLDSILHWRAVTPAAYETEFNLPEGHATSFAGGPLAALRNPNPELTDYETAVPGLYLTGAATFPGAGVWGASGRNCAGVILEQRA